MKKLLLLAIPLLLVTAIPFYNTRDTLPDGMPPRLLDGDGTPNYGEPPYSEAERAKAWAEWERFEKARLGQI